MKQSDGMSIQTNSFFMTLKPLGVRNRFRLIGDTSIGRHGKKYRSLLKGEKNATPRPPFVMASRMLCKSPLAKKTQKERHLAFMDFPAMNFEAVTAMMAAKKMPCENPRWPSQC